MSMSPAAMRLSCPLHVDDLIADHQLLFESPDTAMFDPLVHETWLIKPATNLRVLVVCVCTGRAGLFAGFFFLCGRDPGVAIEEVAKSTAQSPMCCIMPSFMVCASSSLSMLVRAQDAEAVVRSCARHDEGWMCIDCPAASRDAYPPPIAYAFVSRVRLLVV
jgi:hypothetical protein